MGAGQSTNGQSSPEIVKLQTEFAEANTKIDSIYKNNNNLATSLDLNTAVLPLAKTADMTNLVQKSDITALTSSFNINNLVQKSDLADVAQKTDLAGVAQKTDLADVAKTSDLSGVAQKSDIASLSQYNTNNLLNKTDITNLQNSITNLQNSITNNPKQIMNILSGLNPDNSVSCPYMWIPNPDNIVPSCIQRRGEIVDYDGKFAFSTCPSGSSSLNRNSGWCYLNLEKYADIMVCPNGIEYRNNKFYCK